MSPNRREFLALGVGALAVATLPRALRPRSALVRRQIPVMGTVGEVAVRHRDGAWAQRALDAALAELRRVERTMTRFRDDSDVGRINLARGGSVRVSEDTAAVLAAALSWAETSEGRFDPCLGRLASGERSPEGWPGVAGALEVDRGGSVPLVRLHRAEAAVDLGGIAKGYAVDQAAGALREQGVFHALVNAGGDLVAMGVDAEGEPWTVGVRSPEHPERIAHVLRVADAAVATSGTYFRGAHLIDPVTGNPLRTPVRSLTVQAPNCMAADAGATAVYGAPEKAAEAVLSRGAPGARIVHKA